MYLSTTPVVGIAADEYWPQVFKHHGPNASFVVCFYIKSGTNVRQLGRQFLESIEQLPRNSNAELSAALVSLLEKTGPNVGSFCAGYVSGNMVTIWSSGKGAVLLKRGQKIGKIVQSEPLKVVEGSVRQGDMFVFATDGFLHVCPEPLNGVFDNDEELAALCIPKIQEHAKGSRAAAYMVEVHEGERAMRPGMMAVETIDPAVATVEEKHTSSIVTKVFSGLASMIKPVVSRSRKLTGQSKRTKIIALLMILLVMLAVSLLIGFSKRQATLREQKVQQILQPYEQQLAEAKSKQSVDVMAARQLAATALAGAQDKQSQLGEKSYERLRVNEFVATAQEYFNSISGEKSLDALDVFYNLQLVKSGFIANSIAIAPNTLAFLDLDNNSAINLSIDKKQPSAPNTSAVTGSRDIAIDGGKTYILGDGIFEAGKVVVEKTDSWNNPQLLGVFNGNLYVFDKGANALMKYTAGDDGGFDSGVSWIKSSPGLDFDLVTSMAIDGKVWIVTSKGEIFPFVQGTKENFQVKGLSTPFSSTLRIYTDTDLENLYILEASAGRVVVLSKEGEFKASYLSKDLGAATGIVVEPGETTAYISAGSVVYSLLLE